MQEDYHGGLNPKVLQAIRRLGQAFQRDPNHTPTSTLGLRTGLELARDWNGTRHVVRVTETGFSYEGKPFRSLSEVARAITGTRWSGPAFFGTKPQKRAA